MADKLFTTTFYSFKGGVGRSLALINVAVELAKDGNNVAIIDFDLEAPGLQTYSIFKSSGSKPLPKVGLIEFILEYVESCNSEPMVPEITPFLYEAEAKNLNKFSDCGALVNGQKVPTKTKAKFESTAQGKIWLMPARGKGSKKDPTAIDWKGLYSEKNGFLLMEELKARIQEKTDADYLLIDSRTGLSDHSLICTNQLADALAVIYFPNIQNLEGLKGVMDDLREHQGVKEENIRFIASRIPVGDDEDEILRGMLKDFRSELKITHPELKLHQNTSFSLLEQEIFSLERTRNTQLFLDYLKLTTEIESLNVKSKRGTLEFLRRNIYRLEEEELNKADTETRKRVIPRLNEAGYSFLDSVAVNFAVSRSLKSLSGTLWEGEVNGVREKAFLHFFMAFILNQKSEKYEDLTTPSEVKQLALNLIYMLLISDYSFEQLEEASITELLLEQYNLDGDGFELEKDNKIIKSIDETPARKILDGISALLIPENEEVVEMYGPPDFYIVLILWRNRHTSSSKGLMLSKFDYEVFNETQVRKARRVIDRFYSADKYEEIRKLFYTFSEVSQTDIVDDNDMEYQKPLLDLVKEKGFSVDVSFEIRDTISKAVGIKQFLADYLGCLCELAEDKPGYAVVKFLEGRTDTHTDFGRSISRAIIYKIIDDKQMYQRAIEKAGSLLKSIPEKYENFTIEGKTVDRYFSYLTLTRRKIEDAEAEFEFIVTKTGTEILAELEKIPK